jgi:hypothetical protein
VRVKAKPSAYAEISKLVVAGSKTKNWTVDRLAQEVGVERRTVLRWRKGVSLPDKLSLITLERLGVVPRGTWLRLRRIRLGMSSVPLTSERCTGLLT